MRARGGRCREASVGRPQVAPLDHHHRYCFAIALVLVLNCPGNVLVLCLYCSCAALVLHGCDIGTAVVMYRHPPASPRSSNRAPRPCGREREEGVAVGLHRAHPLRDEGDRLGRRGSADRPGRHRLGRQGGAAIVWVHPRVRKRVSLEEETNIGAPSGPTLRPSIASSLGAPGYPFGALIAGTRLAGTSGKHSGHSRRTQGRTLGAHTSGVHLACVGRSPPGPCQRAPLWGAPVGCISVEIPV